MPSAETDPFESALGPLREVELSAGRLRYRDQGQGRPVVFLAGLLLPSGFWRQVVSAVESPIRAIIPDLPLGGHSLPMRREADLSPPALADLVAEFLEALDLSEAIIVGNDTGGVIAQLLVTRQPQRVAGLVLAPSDAFENFLPPVFRYLQISAFVPGGVWQLAQGMRFTVLRRAPFGFGLLSKKPIEKSVFDSYIAPLQTNRGVRRDLGKVLRGIRRRYTREVAEKLADFDKPSVLAWPPDSRLLPFEHAQRLAEILPRAVLAPIADSYALVPQDQPSALAEEIDALLARSDLAAQAKVEA